jgi:hypothetical protein
MGCSTMQWRARIGLYGLISGTESPNINTNAFDVSDFSQAKYRLLLCVLTALLVIGGVEKNPGPDGKNDASQASSPALTLELLADLIRSTAAETSVNLNESINTCKKETLDAVNVLRADLLTATKKLNIVEKELDNANKRINVLEDSNAELTKKVMQLESSSRKNNIIVFGVPENLDVNETYNTTLDIVLKLFNDKLGSDCSSADLNSIYRIGKVRGKRPILVSFVQFSKKISVMSNSSKLKGSEFSMSDDLIPQARAERKLILKCAKEASDAKLSVKIKKMVYLLMTCLYQSPI